MNADWYFFDTDKNGRNGLARIKIFDTDYHWGKLIGTAKNNCLISFVPKDDPDTSSGLAFGNECEGVFYKSRFEKTF